MNDDLMDAAAASIGALMLEVDRLGAALEAERGISRVLRTSVAALRLEIREIRSVSGL